MTNTVTLQSVSRTTLLAAGIVVAVLVGSLVAVQYANAAITASLDIGSTGSNVTQLQTYLATDPSIYPSGLVTGYFGPLTQAGVQKFQTAQGIISNGTPETTGYGRVGPQTMARLNTLMGSNNVSWDTVPVLSGVSVQLSNTSASFSWATNEPTQGQLYFDTTLLRADEATGPHQLPYVSGTLASGNAGLQNSHMITLTNLQPNTVYYYLVRGIDSGGNVSMTWPTTFRTNN